ncbi:MAG TPA: alpha-2-macroglobulin [Caulobacteraceae bacterium]
MNRSLVAAAIAALVVGFGGGFLVAKGVDGAFRGHPGVAASPGASLWSLFGKPRSADAPRRGIPKPEGFAVWKTRMDTSGAQPLACVEMSKPLDPSKSYSDFVLVSPDLGHAPAVTAKDDELCIGGVGFADRRITLLKGLPGAGGQTLADNADVDFTFGEKPPYVGFAGSGVILPREESDGVGIETINVTKLAVEVWRVPARNLPRKSISAPQATGEGDYPDDYGEDSPDDEGTIVWKGTVPVKGDPAAKLTTVFPLGAVLKEMKPGGYVIKVRDNSGGRDPTGKSGEGTQPAQARRWIMFTDMALAAYTGQNALDVVVRSLKTAQVLPGLQVALVAQNGEDLGVAKTDASGRATFPHSLLEGEGAATAKMVMAYGPAGDLAVIDLSRSPVDLSKQAAGGRQPGSDAPGATEGRTPGAAVDAFLYADRGIYRPGETVRLVALVRDLEAKAVTDRKGYVLVKRPSGVEFKRYPFDKAQGGAVTDDVVLPKSAPRGHWTAELHMDGLDAASGNLSFSVEDFAPQRLAVTTEGRAAQPVTGTEARAIDVSARFLYGAIGSGLQTQGEARLRADPNPFPQFQGYEWGDEKNPFSEKMVELGTTVTDGAGHANLVFNGSEAGDTTVPLVAQVTASVFEPGGRPVREGLSLKVRTRPAYLGVKVDEGQAQGQNAPPVTMSVIAVNAQGQSIAAPNVSYSLITENWNYDWYQQDGKWQWRRTSRDVVVMKGVLNIAAGQGARLNKKLGWGDYRLELTGADGVTMVRRFSAGWGSTAEDADSPDMVRVSAGEKTYQQGDTVEIAIKPPYGGEVEAAVATDRLIDLKTASVGDKGGVIRLKTSAAWGGGAYVLVSVIQPRDPVSSPKPRRALGLIYVKLDPKGRKLTVDIGTPAKIDSNAPVEVPVHVRGLGFGQTAHVTVAAVDQGILALTKFASPDPADWYFGKRALTVDYRDDYGRLLDANLGAPANINFGGDELGGEGLTVTPIKTVALWSGVVETGMDGRAVVKLPAAAFNGEVRIMAVAWTDNAVGSGSTPMTVRQPVVADLDLPRFLSPGDKAFATLELHNVEGRPGLYSVETWTTNGIAGVFKKAYQLLVNTRIAEHIPFLAPNYTGVGKVGFKVAGPGFNTAKDYDIQTRLGWGPVTRATTALQQPGETYTPPAALLSGMAAGDITMQVSYSPFKGFDPAPIALDLLRYPYGCTEQLVSTAYPLLYASEVSNDPRIARGFNDAVGKLLDRQTLDGAFGLWRVGDGEADAWLGAYATDFLLEAKAHGSPVPDEAVDKALSAMRQISRPDGFASVAYRLEYPDWWGGNKDAAKKATERMRSRAAAYALYDLAKGGRGDLARLRWWHDVQMKDEAAPLSIAQVGAGLAMMGDHARAHDALVQAAQKLGYQRSFLQIGPIFFVEDEDYYQSPLRDLGAVIALAYEAGEFDLARGLQARLDGAVKDPGALNTQEAAALLRAAHFMLKASGPPKIAAAGALALPASGGTPRWGVGRLTDARFTNQGGAIWRTVTVRGTPIATPTSETAGLSVTKTFYGFTGGPVNLASLKQGDRVIVLVRGDSSRGQTTALAVDDALPAGFEIETTLSPDDAQTGPFKFLGKLTTASVQEARDDRYMAAMSLPGHGHFALAYVARAVTPGDFFLPSAQAIDMYHAAVFGRSSPGRLVVAAGP